MQLPDPKLVLSEHFIKIDTDISIKAQKINL